MSETHRAATTDDDRLVALMGSVRYHRAMAIANAGDDAAREHHARQMRDALDAIKQIALHNASNDNPATPPRPEPQEPSHGG